MSELKPCPFCGGEAEEMHGHPRYIECKNCNATSGYAGGANREASVKIWNTRSQPDNSDKYQEILYAVATKFPNESRHETALRYIRQAESHDNEPPKELGDNDEFNENSKH